MGKRIKKTITVWTLVDWLTKDATENWKTDLSLNPQKGRDVEKEKGTNAIRGVNDNYQPIGDSKRSMEGWKRWTNLSNEE